MTRLLLTASLVAAGSDACACAEVQDIFFAPTLRVYTSADIVGAELGGAVKNVIAIAAGLATEVGVLIVARVVGGLGIGIASVVTLGSPMSPSGAGVVGSVGG